MQRKTAPLDGRGRMVNQRQVALNDAAEWLGDWHPLAEQLGSAAGVLTLGSISRHLRVPEVADVPSLRRFLSDYQDRILAPFELPCIYAARRHAERNELRELIELDRSLASGPHLKLFEEASRRIGRWQLEKLRALRDQRFVQRYREATRQGEADGWHTLVYGVTLAVYSLPSRQGLMGYAHQVMRGHIHSAARELALSEADCREVFDEFSEGIRGVVHHAIQSCPDEAEPARR